ncbi:Uncharacterised protein [Vibrio cholerae]|nr:Uncharacterised protein [Vibrio cholerae]
MGQIGHQLLCDTIGKLMRERLSMKTVLEFKFNQMGIHHLGDAHLRLLHSKKAHRYNH